LLAHSEGLENAGIKKEKIPLVFCSLIRNFAAKGREAAYARPLKQVSWSSLNRSFVSRKQKRVAYD